MRAGGHEVSEGRSDTPSNHGATRKVREVFENVNPANARCSVIAFLEIIYERRNTGNSVFSKIYGSTPSETFFHDFDAK
jgi:hypothetical protein